MKAKVTYASGLMLIISCYDNQPMLLMEWLAAQKTNKLHKVIKDPNRDTLKIRLNSASREDFDNCAEYINLNSSGQ